MASVRGCASLAKKAAHAPSVVLRPAAMTSAKATPTLPEAGCTHTENRCDERIQRRRLRAYTGKRRETDERSRLTEARLHRAAALRKP